MEKISKKYLEGRATDSEKEHLLDWLRQGGNQQAFKKIKLKWKGSLKDNPFPGGGQEGWTRLQAGLWRKSHERWQSNRKIQLFLSVAAIFFFLVSVGSLYLYSMKSPQPIAEKFTSVLADNGQISKVELPDGTMVWLNSGSKISYSNLFSSDNRNVELTGEAYFDVAKDEKLPMVVNIGNLSVKVLGTRFNVNGYESESSVEVVLEEGSVELLTAGRNDVFHSMKAGERANINLTNNQFSAGMVNPARYISWTKGIINIYNLPIEEVVKRLEKRYNQQFELEPEVMGIRYTFTIQNESLEDILKLMEKITPINAVQNENTIRIIKTKAKYKETGG